MNHLRLAGIFIAIGALLACLGVGAGAFGAHILDAKLSADAMATYQTAVTYQMYHAIGLILFGLILRTTTGLPTWPGWCFTAGTLIFSGSLYLLLATGITKLGAITPIGGVLMITAWAGTAYTAIKTYR